MIQKSIRGFLWIPLEQDNGRPVTAAQSQERSSNRGVDHSQSECSGESIVTSANHGDHGRASDPPSTVSPTKSARKKQAGKKREHKRDVLERKCKKTHVSVHEDTNVTRADQDESSPVHRSDNTGDTEPDSNITYNVDPSGDRSLSDMLASALRDSPLDSDQNITVSNKDSADDMVSQVIFLESQLVASRIETESATSEIARLKTIIELLEEESKCDRKICSSQKQEIKSLKSSNDNLRRELSRFRGMRKLTNGENKCTEKSTDKSTDQYCNTEIADMTEQVNVATAKLQSFKEQMVNVTSSMLKLLEDENMDDVGDTTDPFQTVISRKRRRTTTPPGTDAVTGNSEPAHGRPMPIPVIVNRAPSSAEVTSTHSYSHALLSTPPLHTTSRVAPKYHETRNTLIIGTSLTRGVGTKLVQQGIQATSYIYAGCEIPHIRERIPYIVPKTNNPTHVILQCGGNDAERRPAERVIAQYESLIEAVRRACPNAYISVSRIPPRRNNNTILNKIGQINAHLEQKCSGDQGLSFVDACPDSIYLYKRDLVHFNGRGIKFYADKLKEHIQGFRARGVTRPM